MGSSGLVGLTTIVRAHEQDIRVSVGVTEDEADRVAPCQVDHAIARRRRRLQGHAGGIDVPRKAEPARACIRSVVHCQPKIPATAFREFTRLRDRHHRGIRSGGNIESGKETLHRRHLKSASEENPGAEHDQTG